MSKFATMVQYHERLLDMQRVIAITCLSLLLVAGTAAWAQDNDADVPSTATIEPVTVTARGNESPVSETPGGIGIVTEEELFMTQPNGIADAARRISGVEKSSDSPWGSEINIRGLGRDAVILLVDGCRVNTATDINARFGLVAPADIERIEVLKGPISALYGTGSTGGVVNVITKKGRMTPVPQYHAEGRVAVGDNPSGSEEYFNLSYGNQQGWAYASASYRDKGSYTAGDGAHIDNSQFRDYQGKIYAGYQWNDRNVSEFRVLRMEGRDIGIPGKGLSLPEGPRATYPRVGHTLINALHTLSPDSTHWKESTLSIYFDEIERRVLLYEFPAGPVSEIRPSADHRTWGGRWQNLLEAADHTLVTGVGGWSWRVKNTGRIRKFTNGTQGFDSALGDVQQLCAGLYAEDTWRMAPTWALNAGGRWDYLEAESNDLYNWTEPPIRTTPIVLKRQARTDSDSAWNAHLGLTWNWRADWTMTLIGASSYRAPDLMERYKYINLGGGVELYGNPDLEPERSYFAEYRLHYSGCSLVWSAGMFANCLENLITEEQVTPTARRMANVDEAVISGIESDLEYHPFDNVVLYANATWLSGRNVTEDDDLAFIPPLHGLVGACWQSAQGITGQAEVEWAAEQNQVPDGTLDTPAWATINLRLGYRFIHNGVSHEFMFGVDNLLDEKYRNALSTSRGMDLEEPGIGFLAVWNIAL